MLFQKQFIITKFVSDPQSLDADIQGIFVQCNLRRFLPILLNVIDGVENDGGHTE